MQPVDTSVGGTGKSFPETTADFLTLFRTRNDPEARDRLAVLCQRYWKPIYAYLRMAWQKSNDDAKDLTQAFFLWLLEEKALEDYDPERGGFRTYLKILLRSFIGHEQRALSRLKRGGGVRVIPLDGSLPAERGTEDPEKAFERLWILEVARHAIDRVRERCVSEGRALRFRVYQEYALAPECERPSYREVASRLGIAETEVERYLFEIRRSIREEVRVELRQTTTGDRELEDECKRIFGR